MTSVRPTVVCVTPVRNEAWILERFLAAASTWADRIVIADQGSDDGSRELALRNPKVILVDNDSAAFNDGAHRRLLLDTARTIPDPRVLISLDADESLSPSVQSSPAWREAISAPPGTVIRLRWVNLLPGGEKAWVPREPIIFGLVDDGRPYSGDVIHPTRLPTTVDAANIEVEDVTVLHYQYLDEERMRAKQRWYQCFERLEFPDKRAAEIYRQYHHMDSWPEEEIHSHAASHGEALAGAFTTGAGQDPWHRRILGLMNEHGSAAFRHIDIWGVDWAAEAARLGVELSPSYAADPRTALDRAVVRWLRFAQTRRRSRAVRAISRSLQVFGW